jgi:hypothetical protein
VELGSRDEDAMLGTSWRLERRTSGGWTWEYTLVSDGDGASPTWWPADEDRPAEQPLVPAPVTLIVPPAAVTGDYRICQGSGSANVCVPIRVVD